MQFQVLFGDRARVVKRVSVTAEEIQFLAQKAQWNVDCTLKPNTGRYSPFNGDSVIITGDGVDDLDRLLALMGLYPNGAFVIDVGSTESAYRPVSIAEVQALKTAYMAFWGNVNKPLLPEDGVESAGFGR